MAILSICLSINYSLEILEFEYSESGNSTSYATYLTILMYNVAPPTIDYGAMELMFKNVYIL